MLIEKHVHPVTGIETRTYLQPDGETTQEVITWDPAGEEFPTVQTAGLSFADRMKAAKAAKAAE